MMMTAGVAKPLSPANEALPEVSPAIAEALASGSHSIRKIVDLVLSEYAERTALLWRRPVSDGLARAYEPAFQPLSYAELHKQVIGLSATFVHPDGFGLNVGDSVCTLGFTGPEYVAIYLVLLRMGLVSVPLQTASTVDQVLEIAGEVHPKALASSIELLDIMVGAAIARGQPTKILVFDYDPAIPLLAEAWKKAAQRAASVDFHIALVSFSDAMAFGQALPPVAPPEVAPGENPICNILYTSGSTGSPKGAIQRDDRIAALWLVRPGPQVTVHYQPLSHGYGMTWVFSMLTCGGESYFTASSDLSTLLEDVAVARPTNLPLVPRVCELIFQRAQSIRRSRPNITIEELRHEILGDRMTSSITGSAPLSPELKAFMDELCGFTITDAYGATEVGMIARDGVIQKPPVIDHKLIDVPELGYFTTDQPYPRGELLIKSQTLIEGYLGRDDLNAKLVDADGFYHTGDIMEETSPGVIRFLDRRNNVLKLSQGEFVALAKLEAIYSHGHPALDKVFLYGNSNRSYLLAVAVPNPDVVDLTASDVTIRAELLQALRAVAVNNQLNAYEIPRDLIVEREAFSRESGLLSGIGKYLRPRFKERYQDRLEALYAEMARKQEEELDGLRSTRVEEESLPTVLRAVRSVLNVDAVAIEADMRFAELGGDSLSAISLAMLLEDVFEVPVDVSMVMHPSETLADLAIRIDVLRRRDTTSRPSIDDVHHHLPSSVAANELTLEQVIDPQVLEAAALLPQPAAVEPDVVLLTGANGFLGRFLCLEWLERMERRGSGQLICLVRGTNDEIAAKRLDEAFDSGDAALLARFRSLASRHLRVIAADLALHHLGLADETWSELARDVDLIIHPGALVNHRLHYRQLFQPNVMATADLIALSLTHRIKRFVNVSTIGVPAAVQGRAPLTEDEDVAVAIPVQELDDSYANGYRVSKWAGEVMLAQAAERFGLPALTFRSNMIMPHTQYSGQLNVPDMLTRLLLSIVLTGLAPGSFYLSDAAKAHYEGLPVDFIAKAIVEIGESQRRGTKTFHVLSGHDDGISLDSFIDWIRELGYPVATVSSYEDWVARLEIALLAFPANKRNASVLPVLEHYASQTPAAPGGTISSSQFAAGVAATELNSTGTIPQLSRETIRKYLSDLASLELIPERVPG